MNWQLGLALVSLAFGTTMFFAGFIGQVQDVYNNYFKETSFLMIIGLLFVFIGGALL